MEKLSALLGGAFGAMAVVAILQYSYSHHLA